MYNHGVILKRIILFGTTIQCRPDSTISVSVGMTKYGYGMDAADGRLQSQPHMAFNEYRLICTTQINDQKLRHEMVLAHSGRPPLGGGEKEEVLRPELADLIAARHEEGKLPEELQSLIADIVLNGINVGGLNQDTFLERAATYITRESAVYAPQ